MGKEIVVLFTSGVLELEGSVRHSWKPKGLEQVWKARGHLASQSGPAPLWPPSGVPLNKIEKIQRRLEWALRKDDTHKLRSVTKFFFFSRIGIRLSQRPTPVISSITPLASLFPSFSYTHRKSHDAPVHGVPTWFPITMRQGNVLTITTDAISIRLVPHA